MRNRDRVVDYRNTRAEAEQLRREYARLVVARGLADVVGVYVTPRKLGGRWCFAVIVGGYAAEADTGLSPEAA
jgi:hypothetical protein